MPMTMLSTGRDETIALKRISMKRVEEIGFFMGKFLSYNLKKLRVFISSFKPKIHLSEFLILFIFFKSNILSYDKRRNTGKMNLKYHFSSFKSLISFSMYRNLFDKVSPSFILF